MRAKRLVLLVLVVACCRRGAARPEPAEPAAANPESAAPAGEPEAEKEGGPKHIKVRCAPVTQQLLRDRIEVHGTVMPLPDRDALVTPQVAGRLTKVLVREGDPVKQGQVVAEVDPGPIADQLREAQALVAKAAAEEQNARVTLERVERVFQRGIAARQEVDDASARAAAARAAQAQAAAAARRAQRQLEFATVRSPLAGVVLRVLHHSGELVDGTPATAVVEVGDPSALELYADAAAQDLVQLTRQSPATVVFSALPGRSWPGTVAAVAPAVDRTTGLGKVRVALQLAPPGHGIAPPVGLYGTALIASGESRQGLLVPSTALRNRSGLLAEVVVCSSAGTAQVRPVQLGLTLGSSADAQVEVRSPSEDRAPLAPTDRVAVEPVLGINEGDVLEVAASPVPAPTSPAAASDGGSHD
jgi:RND family efflux transporter MFP subunit